MQYEEFLESIKQAIQKKDKRLRIKTVRVPKTNCDQMDSMTILKEGENMSPAIYLEGYYRQFQEGAKLDEIAEQILQVYEANKKGGVLDMSFYQDFSKIRNNIACRLVNYEKNELMLEQVPHCRFLDLAIVYYYKMDDPVIGKGSILVQNSHLDIWGIDQERLHDIAVSNTVRLLPYEFIDITELLKDVFGITLDPALCLELPMYILTNVEKYYGAVSIIYDSILDAIAWKLDSDFFILPSSIHECMVIPALEGIGIAELLDMVKEVNQEHVAEDEVLGNAVYWYGRSEKKLKIVSGGNRKENI